MGKVAIIHSFNTITLKTYGVGDLVVDKIPNYDFFSKYQIRMNSVLINNVHIWEFQGKIISIEQYEQLRKSSIFIEQVYPEIIIEPSEPAVFYGYVRSDNKVFIRNFTSIKNVDDLRGKVFIKKFVEPFEANSLNEAKLKLNLMLKC